jgi:hypothetical protein
VTQSGHIDISALLMNKTLFCGVIEFADKPAGRDDGFPPDATVGTASRL